MSFLLDFPNEVIHNVLGHVDPQDLAAVAASCKDLDSYVKHNMLLHKEHLLASWDHPLPNVADGPVVWDEELHKCVKFKLILESGDPELKKSNLEFLTTMTCSLLKSASQANEHINSRSVYSLRELYELPLNIHVLLRGSSIFARAYGDDTPYPNMHAYRAGQFHAKLHCLHGIPVQLGGSVDEVPLHPYARARVYDLRRYTSQTFWGPFRDDGTGTVDWEKMEAIMIILDHNWKLFMDRCDKPMRPSWKVPFYGATPHSYTPRPKTLELLGFGKSGKSRNFGHSGHSEYSIPLVQQPSALDMQDPYNVSGSYFRIVCFLDYSELFAYNFAVSPPGIARDRDPLNTDEATRLIVMALRLTKLEKPGEHDGQALPVAHFTGKCRSYDNPWDPDANSEIRGTVRLTKEGEVRWTTFSIYHGEERWRTEGIQVGGPNSARGVMGNWFDKLGYRDYDRHGPAGPTAFWKLDNRDTSMN